MNKVNVHDCSGWRFIWFQFIHICDPINKTDKVVRKYVYAVRVDTIVYISKSGKLETLMTWYPPLLQILMSLQWMSFLIRYSLLSSDWAKGSLLAQLILSMSCGLCVIFMPLKFLVWALSVYYAQKIGKNKKVTFWTNNNNVYLCNS